MAQKYKIADFVFEGDFIYALSNHLLKKYEYSGEIKPALKICYTMAEIESQATNYPNMPLPYVENTLVFKRFCDFVLNYQDGIIFHSSAIAVDGKAYLFTAPSGTGKSTHTALWRELFGDRAVMINDDKPLIRFVDGSFYVYGTPWNGKHGLDTDCRVKIQAICHLKRGKVNVIKPITAVQMLPIIIGQTLRPSDVASAEKLLSLVENLLQSVGLYEMECNTDIESAKLAYKIMNGEEL